MDRPALVGIDEPRPLPRWRLVLALILLLSSGVGLSLALRLITFPIPCFGGFLFLHWLIPVGVSMVGLVYGIHRGWTLGRRRSSFWGALVLTALQITALLSWFSWRRHMRDLNHFVYSSQVEYVSAEHRPPDWLDPTHPQIYELGGGLRLALSPVVWTDGLHRSLPLGTAPALEPYPETGGPRPLTELGRRNLGALMKASALIRFFHPTDAAQFSDWGRLISQGVRQVEDAPSPEELAKRLHALLAPYAPTARFLLPGEPVPVISPPARAKLLARWRHVGIGFECAVQAFTGLTKDRSARLAGVGMAWTTLQHFYPYWDVVGVDWESALNSSLAEAALAPTHEAYFEAIQHLSALLKDGHAWPDYFGNPMLAYPDVELQALDGRPLVAARWGLESGIPLGAEVLKIDGQPVDQLMAKFRAKSPGSTARYQEAMAARWLLLAPPGRSHTVEVSDLAGTRSLHDLVSHQPRSRRHLPEPILEIRPGILLIALDRLDREAFNKALPRMIDAKGLIFDHRGYPEHMEFLRHFRTEDLEGIQMHLPVSRLPHGQGRTFEVSRFRVRSERPTYRGKVVVLAGGPDNISAAETSLEIVAANHLAPIVGRPTMGTNGDVITFFIPGNVECVFTGTKVLKADGSQHHGIGILPTHPVKHTREALAAGRDQDVERALELIAAGQ